MNERAHRLYKWEMRFATGKVAEGMAGATPFDPNAIPAALGCVTLIKLVPRDPDSNLPTVPFAIPPGTEGFHNRDVSRLNGTVLSGLAFRVGYRTDDYWFALCVNASDGIIYWERG